MGRPASSMLQVTPWGWATLPLFLALLSGCLRGVVTSAGTMTPNATTNCSGSPTIPPWGNTIVPEQKAVAKPLKSESVMVETNKTGQLPWPPLSVLQVQPGPTSLTVTVGSLAELRCEFQANPNASVIWSRACSANCTELLVMVNGSDRWISVDGHRGTSLLAFPHAEKQHSGLYYCRVEANDMQGQSCGTYLRVRKPMPTSFLNMRESTKNQIITAEGILLLFCAVGPGLFLLFRKRWANERLLQAKKSAYEEENLYEGLNLDDCSMYEDISRGLQSTYQDVANIRGSDIQLEKP
ncbi:B-cell antigen receptor complex-associated protein alpha chain isoform X1 [Alligator mississippiensis]|uniref:B-cell antigen receptor complex-associated protein alpha chain n=2 Tax=Alligator mississippiensis TaxID=8496 RepID=A0A151NVW6_ALLMI|nr:B-cell antigen receptor complex-associated protein alpha chain isoform X1 [Alligator mississippiensis]KYO40873.1 B-cell antigen receptor complex-associated protein alpha chain [Alligator mississippiensis]